MADLVTDFIGDALRYANVVNYDAPIPGKLLRVSLAVLNDILAEWGVDGFTIPYQSEVVFPLTPGKERYTIGNGGSYDVEIDPIMQITTLSIEDSTSPGVSYQTLPELTELQYSRITYKDAQGIPASYLLRNYIDYSELILQPVPYSSTLSVNAVCKQRLEDVQLGDSLSAIPKSYRTGLKYQLIMQASGIWGKQLLPQQVETWQAALKKIRGQNVKSLDMSVRRDEVINSSQGFIYEGWFYP